MSAESNLYGHDIWFDEKDWDWKYKSDNTSVSKSPKPCNCCGCMPPSVDYGSLPSV